MVLSKLGYEAVAEIHILMKHLIIWQNFHELLSNKTWHDDIERSQFYSTKLKVHGHMYTYT